MNRSWYVTIIFGLGICVAGLLIYSRRTGEPVYQGKSASQWIREFSIPEPGEPNPFEKLKAQADDFGLGTLTLSPPPRPIELFSGETPRRFPARKYACFAAFRAMGAAAIPVLLHGLDHSDSRFRGNAAALLGEIGPIDGRLLRILARKLRLKETAIHKAWRAVWSKLPRSVRRHIPAPNLPDWYHSQGGSAGSILITLVKRNQVLRRASMESVYPVADLVPELIVALNDDDDVLSQRAGWVLGHLGADARAAVPALIVALQQRSDLVSRRAAWALGQIGPEAKAAVPSLIQSLQRQTKWNSIAARHLYFDQDLRSFSITALGNIGPDAEPAVPALTELLHHEDRGLRKSAFEALRRITGKTMGEDPWPSVRETVPTWEWRF